MKPNEIAPAVGQETHATVPREPTAAMIVACPTLFAYGQHTKDRITAIWQAMWDAACAESPTVAASSHEGRSPDEPLSMIPTQHTDGPHAELERDAARMRAKIGRMRRALRQLNKAHIVLWKVVHLATAPR